MKSFAVAAALVGAVAAMPQASSASSAATPASFSHIAPKATDPAGCQSSYNGQFEIQVVNVTSTKSKRDAASTNLEVTLADGVLTDAKGRIGYIASNNQFQFDYGTQAGAIYTTGWSVCANNTLALGSSAIFYQCLSGTFYNLYDTNSAPQCTAVYIDVLGGSSSSSGSASGAASQIPDGQVTASPVSQITDGQIQATTGTPKPVTQIGDGQIQATTGTAKPVSQISDGQIQATTGTAKPVTQISDGQIQATTGTAKPISQISDGQIQAPTNGTRPTSASATVQAFTGAAATPALRGELFGLAAGILAIAAL